MLKIQKTVLKQIEDCFLSKDTEQGFLLGSKQNLEKIDMCCPVPVEQVSTYFIIPDAERADWQIKDWQRRKVCFCGMIHSHICPKEDLSEADRTFAEQLYKGYRIPVLWFGLGIVKTSKVEFKFYRVEQKNQKILIRLEKYEVVATQEE